MSSIITFSTGRVVKSPRDNYFNNREVTEEDLINLAIQNPILVAGPGCTNRSIAKEELNQLIKDIKLVISLLWKIPIEKYRKFMNGVRLATLSIYNLRTDFGLGYYLMVSSIESVAQMAIKRKSTKSIHVNASGKIEL